MNVRQKSMIIGAILGASMGVLGGYLFTRGLEFPREDEEPQSLSLRAVPPGDLVKIFIAIMGVLRSIAVLGERV
ncbi:hypothetical protein ACFLWA_01720 [Chloroflexota bacterium]